jgi:hypothetical protein
MARKILDNPPPLTPRALRNFPYSVRSFPTRYLLENSGLAVGAPAKVGRKSAENEVE